MAARLLLSLLLLGALGAARRAPPRTGRFLSTHLDLLSAASELFPSAFQDFADLTASSSQRQVSEQDDALLEEQEFGSRLSLAAPGEGGEEAGLVEGRAEGPGMGAYQEDPPRRPYGGYRRRPVPEPEPEPEPLVIICKDPNYCPPPYAPHPYGPRPSYPAPGLTLCRDPSDCPAPYGAPSPRPYRLRPRPPQQGEEDPPPRYTAETTTRRPVKKYGYHPVKSNPTIYRQEVMSMKTKEPAMDLEEVEEVDIENMTMEELREFIAAAEAEKESPKPTEFEKLVVPAASPAAAEGDMERVVRVLSNMNVQELVDFVKASSVLEAGVPVLAPAEVEQMDRPELVRLLGAAEQLPKVLKQVDEGDIRKMTKETLKEVVEDILEDHEEDLQEMTKAELKEIVMEAVVKNPADKPKVIKHVDEQDVSKMTKETLREVAEDIIENKIETVPEMTKQELKEIVMEVAVEKEELIVVPVAEEDIQQMNVKELKEFVKEAADLADERPIVEVTENDVAKMSMDELKDFISSAEDEASSLQPSVPVSEVDIQAMSPRQLKAFVMEAVIETRLLRPILIPIRETELIQMSKEGLKELIMETPALVEKVIATEEANPGKKAMTMKKIIAMQKKRKMEKPVKMLIKGGMLFKDGMTTEEKKAEDMGLTVKEMVSRVEGLTRGEVREIDDGITVEEMIAIENDVSVEEMIAMKNDLTMEQVTEIKETMTVDEILEVKPEISVAEVIAIKNDMSVEEMVAMKNEVSVLEILTIKDKLTMGKIMSLQDGITKQDIVALANEEVTVEEVIENKEGSIQLGTPGPSGAGEHFVRTSGHGGLAGEGGVININEPSNQGLQFSEVTTGAPPEVLQPIRNTNFPTRDILKLEKMQMTRKRKRPRPGVEGSGLRMRPMRVKVRKPTVPETTIAPVVESHLTFGQMENLMEEAFGLKDFPMMRPGEFVQVQDSPEEVTHEDLVLEPTPAVPGRAVTEPRFVFNEFLDETTPLPTVIAVEDVKTVDLQGDHMLQQDYPIYDYDPEPVVQATAPTPPPTLLKTSDFPEMPIFHNFPMMQPGEFIQVEEGETHEALEEYGVGGEGDSGAFTAFSEMDKTPIFDLTRRPETINLFKAPEMPEELRVPEEVDALVGLVTAEGPLSPEVRPFRSPRPRRPAAHPNHRYPLRAPPTPFTARPPPLQGESFVHSSYRHRLRPVEHQAYSGDSDTPHFREIPEQSQHEVKPFIKRKKPTFKSQQKVKPFVTFGTEAESPEDGMRGLNFYQEYGQHDDRPQTARPAQLEASRRPGEIRFGGMSFALPPPGAFPDRPEDKGEVNKEEKISDLYPNHPISEVFPNRPVSQVFRDLPEQQVDRELPADFPAGQGIHIEETGDIEVPSFANFFKDESSYLRNPFGDDFIKLEIDQSSFRTNKSKPGVHHIPLDLHGFPDVPMTPPAAPGGHGAARRKRKPLFSVKPPYKPPPVITRYEPPAEAKVLDYDTSLPVAKASTTAHHTEFSPPSWKAGLFQEAMSSLPTAIRSLPAFMERLMGSHAGWVRRAWRDGRDESAARSIGAEPPIPAFS